MILSIGAKRNFFITFLTLAIVTVTGYYLTADKTIYYRLGTITLLWLLVFMAQHFAPAFQSELGDENLPAFLFVFFAANLYPDLKILALSTVLIYLLHTSIDVLTAKREPSNNKVLNTSFILALATVFHPPLIILLPLLFYTFHHRGRNFLIILVSYALVLYLYLMVEIFLVKNSFSQSLHKLVSWHNQGLGNLLSTYWIFVIILFLLGFVYSWARLATETIKIRRTIWATVLLTVLAFFVNLYTSQSPTVMVLFPLALLWSYVFYTLKTKEWIKDLLLLVIIGLNLFFAFQTI